MPHTDPLHVPAYHSNHMRTRRPLIATKRRWFVLEFLAFAVLWSAALCLPDLLPDGWLGSTATLVLTGVLLLGVGIFFCCSLWLMRYSKLSMLVHRNQGQVCPQCGYPLKDHAATTPCPECGRIWNPAIDVKTWSEYNRAKYPIPPEVSPETGAPPTASATEPTPSCGQPRG